MDMDRIGFNLRSPGTDPADDVATQRDFQRYKFQLKEMLQDIEENGMKNVMWEYVRELDHFLELLGDPVLLRKCGAALVRNFIREIHNIDRELDNVLPSRIQKNSTVTCEMEYNTETTQETESNRIPSPDRMTFNSPTSPWYIPLSPIKSERNSGGGTESNRSPSPDRMTSYSPTSPFYLQTCPSYSPVRPSPTNRETNSGGGTTAPDHWFFGSGIQETRDSQAAPHSASQQPRASTSTNVPEQVEALFTRRSNKDREFAPPENIDANLGAIPPAGHSQPNTVADQSEHISGSAGNQHDGQRELPPELPQINPGTDQRPIQFIFLGPTQFSQDQPFVPRQRQAQAAWVPPSRRHHPVERVLRNPRGSNNQRGNPTYNPRGSMSNNQRGNRSYNPRSSMTNNQRGNRSYNPRGSISNNQRGNRSYNPRSSISNDQRENPSYSPRGSVSTDQRENPSYHPRISVSTDQRGNRSYHTRGSISNNQRGNRSYQPRGYNRDRSRGRSDYSYTRNGLRFQVRRNH